MHWSKRLVFLLTLVAFLSNLSFGMTIPGVRSTQQAGLSISSAQDKFQQKSNKDFAMTTCECLEEIEESELESDLDPGSATKDPTCAVQGFIGFYLQQNNDHQHAAKFQVGAFRTWLWSNQKVIVHFQVFRI